MNAKTVSQGELIEPRLTRRGREMLALLDECERLGWSMREFAARRGLKLSTLQWWRSEIRRRLGSVRPKSSTAFVPVVVTPGPITDRPQSAASRSAISISTPRGFRIEVPSDFIDADLRRVIEVVERC